MSNRVGGLAVMIGGAFVVAVGIAGLVMSGSEASEAVPSTTTPSATSTSAEPTTTTSTTTTVAPTTSTAPPTTTTTIDVTPAIESFVGVFTDAIAREDADLLFETLHPAVIALFDEETCREFVSEEILQLDQYRLIGEVEGPTPQVVADMTVDMYRAPVAFVFQGQEFTSEAAFAIVDAEVRWFTQCGE